MSDETYVIQYVAFDGTPTDITAEVNHAMETDDPSLLQRRVAELLAEQADRTAHRATMDEHKSGAFVFSEFLGFGGDDPDDSADA